ncbi:MAG: SDR family oxidoreductase [Chitinophagaceae bacterium]|nr:MAG: SDR family oxidoreductase [Chitinophagaceae bacterium]
MELKNKKVLITGGSLGIGYAIAEALISEGADVIITGRDKGRLESAAKKSGALFLQADVSKEKDVDATYDFILEKFGTLDILINNAGIGKPAALENLSREKIMEVFDVNVIGAALTTAKFTPLFKEKKSGDIVNIASTAALKGYKNGSIYVASKFALRGMTECWRAELRPFNIRVMLVNPSEVATAFGNSERKERQAQPNKLRPKEIADAVSGILKLESRGFIPELSVWATNPFD